MKFHAQMKEIDGVIRRLGMTGYEELAEAAAINRETMRKYAKGYQVMPDPLLHALKLVEQNRRLLGAKGHKMSTPKTIAISYALMETKTLLDSLSELAGRVKKVSANDRLAVLGNIRAIVDELEAREGDDKPTVTQEELTEMQQIAMRSGQKWEEKKGK